MLPDGTWRLPGAAQVPVPKPFAILDVGRQTRFNLKSRFFDELPEECLKHLSTTAAWAAGGAGLTAVGIMTMLAIQAAARAYSTGAGAHLALILRRRRKDSAKKNLLVCARGRRCFTPSLAKARLTLEGAGDDARAQINFPRHGTKWLALSVAEAHTRALTL